MFEVDTSTIQEEKDLTNDYFSAEDVFKNILNVEDDEDEFESGKTEKKIKN